MTHCHGYKYFFLLEKNEATFTCKRKYFSFVVEKSLDRKFGSVTDKFLFRPRFTDGNFRVSVRSDAESSALLCNIIVLKQIIEKFMFLFITAVNKLN